MQDSTNPAAVKVDTSASDEFADKVREEVGVAGEPAEKPQGLGEFLLRSNVLDLAAAVIIGVAFGAVVASLVNDIIMPPIGLLLGNVDFSNLFINLSNKPVASLAAAKAAGIATINYGLFINTLINFLIVGTVVYLLLRSMARFAPKPATPEASTKLCPYCISKIPLKASRCPNCTSQLGAGATTAV